MESVGAIYFHQSFQIILIAGAIGAFFGGTTALALYRVGLFVLRRRSYLFRPLLLFPHKIQLYHCFLRHCRNFSGCFIQYIRTYCIILATPWRRHRSHVQSIFYLINGGKFFLLVWIAGILIAFLGFLFQLKPWKEKGYWNERRNRG